jgi:putative transcriptional regulator
VSQQLRGKLLVATPDLEDPNFFRSVVLVLEHTDDGALGVVLNRPTGTTMSESIPSWAEFAAAPAVVFVGGPVQPDAAIAIGRSAESEWITVDLGQEPGDMTPPVDRVRVFVGYAGWGAGQLEHEVDADGWFVVDADPGDPWSTTPGDLWRTVLRRQRGQMRVFADFPFDVSQN